MTDADAIVHDLQRKARRSSHAIVDDSAADRRERRRARSRARSAPSCFGDDQARRDLERIVHPAVRARTAELAEAARKQSVRVMVHDIPLLFESADPTAFDRVVLVDAPEAVRRDRWCAFAGLDAPLADRLIAAQMPSADKRARSHYVIENDGRSPTSKTGAARSGSTPAPGPIARSLARRIADRLTPAKGASILIRAQAGGLLVANVPAELRYTSDHEYARSTSEAGVVFVGITDYAQGELGDVVFVNLPKPGDALTAHQVFGPSKP
jgi:dephospho-CoA kinase